ncbi:uncharacterized protein LOC135468973 [Liolophura sinensis]|uniref:uncharacterized protein LOC135468973 n=1 Tax=Liolophura sinensis TaxID=3198878 RepID=UPI0031584381
MMSCQHSCKFFSLTVVLCFTLSCAFPRGTANWSPAGAEAQRQPFPLINSLFSSLLRARIRRLDQLRVSGASSLFKRIGIAGLDNMDAITTTLDRARNRTGPQRMSIRLSMADLRRLMAAGR